MDTSTTNTVPELIEVGKTVDLTYYKTSVQQIVNYIECVSSNIFIESFNELKDKSIDVELDNQEYIKYKYKPRLLSYDIYGTTDLYFIILLLNGVNNEKDFNFKIIKLIRPMNLDILNTILNAEKKYLIIANRPDIPASEPEDEDINITAIPEAPEIDSANTILNNVRDDLNEIKKLIYEAITEDDDIIEVIDNEMVMFKLDIILTKVESLEYDIITEKTQKQIDNIKQDIINIILVMNKIDEDFEYFMDNILEVVKPVVME